MFKALSDGIFVLGKFGGIPKGILAGIEDSGCAIVAFQFFVRDFFLASRDVDSIEQ